MTELSRPQAAKRSSDLGDTVSAASVKGGEAPLNRAYSSVGKSAVLIRLRSLVQVEVCPQFFSKYEPYYS